MPKENDDDDDLIKDWRDLFAVGLVSTIGLLSFLLLAWTLLAMMLEMGT